MEDRLNLREFQARLAERLKSVSSESVASGRLGFVAGGRHWLTALDQVGEVVSVSRLVKAPWTQTWFIGVVSVRGSIYACTDLASFLGVGQAEQRDEIRLLLANARFNSHAAFRIDQVLGLRNIADMKQVAEPTGKTPWEGATYEDASGVRWQELEFESLLTAPVFLQVAA